MTDVVERSCPICGVSKPLRFFRRWRGAKQVLHVDCNACGERTLSAMSHAERVQALAPVPRPIDVDPKALRLSRAAMAVLAQPKFNVSPTAIDRLTLRDRRIRAAKQSGRQQALSVGTRKRQWNRALGTRLRNERDWAKRNLVALTAIALQPLERSSVAPWQEFFRAYIAVLNDMLGRFTYQYNLRSAPTMPTVEQAHPMTYTDTTTLNTLRELYARCDTRPGRRPGRALRTPWCFEWPNYEVPAHLLVPERSIS